MTLAHEYNHILQFGYDAYQDAWFAESTAIWMEDQVYNGINDYLRYVRRWVKPLRHAADRELDQGVRLGGLEPLARAPLRPLDHPQAWARAIHTKPGGFSVAAYDSAIRAAGRSDFSHDFARFSRDVAEWRTGRVFREGPLYPDVPRQGSLPLDGRPLHRLAQPHHLRAAAGPRRARAGRSSSTRRRRGGIAAGLALVGRIGSERHGRVVSGLALQAAAAGRCPCGSPTRAASAASPRCWSTPTPAPTASAPAGSTGTT